MTLWNFDADLVGTVPAGWIVEAGSAMVQADWAYSLPNSFRFDTSTAYRVTAIVSGLNFADGSIDARVRSNNYSDEQHLIFRKTAVDEYYSVRHRTGMNTRIVRYIGGTSYIVASAPENRAADVDFTLRAEFQGELTRVLLDGIVIIDWTDLNYDNLGNYIGPAYTGQGDIGARCAFTAGGVYAWIDDFNAESLVPTQYALTIISAVGGATDPSAGVYVFNENAVVQVTAIPGAGYEWNPVRGSNWDLNGVSYTENPISILMVTDVVLTPIFTELPVGEYVETYNGYEVWYNPTEHYYYVPGYTQTFSTIEEARSFIELLQPPPVTPQWGLIAISIIALVALTFKRKK